MSATQAGVVDLQLAHARGQVAAILGASARKGGRLSLRERTDLATHQRIVTLCEEVLRLRKELEHERSIVGRTSGETVIATTREGVFVYGTPRKRTPTPETP